MTKQWVNNFDELATTPLRRDALTIANAGLSAIETSTVIRSSVSVSGRHLFIKNVSYDLDQFDRLFVVGFGKASCNAVYVLETILGDKIHKGIAIGIDEGKCELVETFEGTHPTPSVQNVEVSKKITELSEETTEKDLVIVVVSGGGSALLCWPQSECTQGEKLYEEFKHTGGSIHELNTVRKHISELKGGGLAKHLYPATVVGMIFSDILGGDPELVASGCTYKDTTTVEDAQAIIDTYNLTQYNLIETPKDDMYFENVTNIVICDNTTALHAMQDIALEMGYDVTVATSDAYTATADLIPLLISTAATFSAVLAGAEPTFEVPDDPGKGGRNQQLALEILPYLTEGQVFLSLASDGNDNDTNVAGALVDKGTFERATFQDMSVQDHCERFDSYPLLQTTNDHIITGPTGANVADLLLLLTNREQQYV